MFSESRYCPHCGVSAVAWEATDSPLRCPTCKTGLRRGRLGNTPLNECPECLGVWLDTATLEQLARDADQQAVLLTGTPASGVSATSSPQSSVFYRPCCVCRDLMLRVNYAKCSGVIVDVCRAHGTWFDQDELQRTVRFIQGGGLQWARARERADLAAERRLLEASRTASLMDPCTSRTAEYQVADAVLEFGAWAIWEWLSSR